jgi:hypothetical protein
MQKETIVHIACADWLRYYRNKTRRIFYFHVPNGGKRNKREAELLKRMGVVPGVMDFWIFSALAILPVEIKAQDTPYSEAQIAAKKHLELLGYTVYTIRTDNPKEAAAMMEKLVLVNV